MTKKNLRDKKNSELYVRSQKFYVTKNKFRALRKKSRRALNFFALAKTSRDTLPHTATHCNTLQHTATHCNTLQHTATHCNTLQETNIRVTVERSCKALNLLKTKIFVLQNLFNKLIVGILSCAACSTLQHTATHFNTLQHTATHCNTLQRTATQ